MSYDKECFELARSFITYSEKAPSTHEKQMELCDKLAQEIQRTIEDFMAKNGLNK